MKKIVCLLLSLVLLAGIGGVAVTAEYVDYVPLSAIGRDHIDVNFHVSGAFTMVDGQQFQHTVDGAYIVILRNGEEIDRVWVGADFEGVQWTSDVPAAANVEYSFYVELPTSWSVYSVNNWAFADGWRWDNNKFVINVPAAEEWLAPVWFGWRV